MKKNEGISPHVLFFENKEENMAKKKLQLSIKEKEENNEKPVEKIIEEQTTEGAKTREVGSPLSSPMFQYYTPRGLEIRRQIIEQIGRKSIDEIWESLDADLKKFLVSTYLEAIFDMVTMDIDIVPYKIQLKQPSVEDSFERDRLLTNLNQKLQLGMEITKEEFIRAYLYNVAIYIGNVEIHPRVGELTEKLPKEKRARIKSFLPQTMNTDDLIQFIASLPLVTYNRLTAAVNEFIDLIHVVQFLEAKLQNFSYGIDA